MKNLLNALFVTLLGLLVSVQAMAYNFNFDDFEVYTLPGDGQVDIYLKEKKRYDVIHAPVTFTIQLPYRVGGLHLQLTGSEATVMGSYADPESFNTFSYLLDSGAQQIAEDTNSDNYSDLQLILSDSNQLTLMGSADSTVTISNYQPAAAAYNYTFDEFDVFTYVNNGQTEVYLKEKDRFIIIASASAFPIRLPYRIGGLHLTLSDTSAVYNATYTDPSVFDISAYTQDSGAILLAAENSGDSYSDLQVTLGDNASFTLLGGWNETVVDAYTAAHVPGFTGTVEYAYNALGQRVSKTVDGVTTYYIYGLQGERLAELDASGNVVREYVYLNGQPLAQVDNPGVANEEIYYSHNDHLGAPLALTDDAKNVVWQVEKTPFGEVVEETGTGVTEQLRGFPGQFADAETGTFYNYYRDYDPSLGRYLQSDPIGLEGGINTYGYVLQNPVMYYDPYGLDSFSVFGQGGFTSGTAGATVKVGLGMDGEGKICMTTTVCGRMGGGVSGSLGVGAEHNTEDFCEGDSVSGGLFGNVGLGLVKSASVTTSGDNVKTSIGIGAGGGVSGGGQTCITKTVCL